MNDQCQLVLLMDRQMQSDKQQWQFHGVYSSLKVWTPRGFYRKCRNGNGVGSERLRCRAVSVCGARSKNQTPEEVQPARLLSNQVGRPPKVSQRRMVNPQGEMPAQQVCPELVQRLHHCGELFPRSAVIPLSLCIQSTEIPYHLLLPIVNLAQYRADSVFERIGVLDEFADVPRQCEYRGTDQSLCQNLERFLTLVVPAKPDILRVKAGKGAAIPEKPSTNFLE